MTVERSHLHHGMLDGVDHPAISDALLGVLWPLPPAGARPIPRLAAGILRKPSVSARFNDRVPREEVARAVQTYGTGRMATGFAGSSRGGSARRCGRGRLLVSPRQGHQFDGVGTARLCRSCSAPAPCRRPRCRRPCCKTLFSPMSVIAQPGDGAGPVRGRLASRCRRRCSARPGASRWNRVFYRRRRS